MKESKWINRISFLMALIMILQFSQVNLTMAATSTSLMTDIKGHWAEKEITEWVNLKRVNGYDDGTFRPDHTITRAEFITLVNSAFGFKEQATITFLDVVPTSWFYNQVARAIQAGYINGYSDNTMRPNQRISREETAVIVARLISSTGSDNAGIQMFKDVNKISDWAGNSIETIVSLGLMKGYSDRTFRPDAPMTRAEVIVTLERALKSNSQFYDSAGTYGPESGIQTINGDVTVEASGTTLRNMVIKGNLLLGEGIGSGDAFLENVSVQGVTTVRGGGDDSIHLIDSSLAEVIVNKPVGIVRILAEGTTTVLQLIVQSSVKIEESALAGEGFKDVVLSKLLPKGARIEFIGSFEMVDIYAQAIGVFISQGNIKQLNVRDTATHLELNLDSDTNIVTLVSEVLLQVNGLGTIHMAILSESAADSIFEQQPIEVKSTLPGSTPPPVVPLPPLPPLPPAPPAKAAFITGYSVEPGIVEGSIRISYTPGNGHTLRLHKTAVATATPLAGEYAGNIGSMYISGANITNAKVGEHIALYEVNSSQDVVKFVDIMLHSSNIGSEPIVTVGGGHNIIVSSDGKVWSWGGNWWGQLGDGKENNVAVPTQITGLRDNVKHISAGGSYSIAVKKDGTVWEWGYKTNSLLPVQVQGLSGVKFVAGGGNPVGRHSAAITLNGELWTWGNNGSGQLGDGTEENSDVPVKVNGIPAVKKVDLGFLHTVALGEDGTVWTWGRNDDGELGIGTTEGSLVPRKVEGLTDIVAVEAGGFMTLALKSDGTVWGWGSNDSGVLGDSIGGYYQIPKQIEGLSDIIRISARETNAVALKRNGSVWVWGENRYGQLGDGTFNNQQTPVQVDGLDNIISVATGDNHMIALRNDGKLFTWGDNTYGQLGIGSTDNVSALTVMPNLNNVRELAQGAFNSAALTNNGEVWVWGSRILGDGSGNGSAVPVKVTEIPSIKKIFNTGYAYMALADNGTVWTWGDLYSRRISEPQQLPDVTDIVDISTSSSHTLFLQADGTVWAMGSNWYGQLGDGTKEDRIDSPVKVMGVSDIKEVVSSRQGQSIALDNEGNMWVWGGHNDHTMVPEILLTGVKAASSEYDHVVALKNDGTLWVWGQNHSGQLGIGSDEYVFSTPVQIPGMSDVKEVYTGYAHTLALKSDGTVWAWGSNDSGQLGDHTTIDRWIPTQVTGLSDISNILTSESNSLAVKSDGTIWGWGSNAYGLFGSVTTMNQTVPVMLPIINLKQLSSAGVVLVLTADGRVWASGYNNRGQLGIGFTPQLHEGLFNQLN